MLDNSIIFSIFLIFTGAAVLAALALFARQSLLVAYILLGGIVGPWGLKLVNDPEIIQQIGHIGIIFLLFLLGLNLQPAQ
ncbi:MAG: cation:proton antiporter, partial [Gammaproteobacteria bacterium]|nr:cation:proton antiporter [Gammaproteobacteria bacterium]